MKSPFSLPSALKFGLIFLCLQVVGTLGQQLLGKGGFYGVSVLGGLVSSASSVASAASLAAHGTISPSVAGIGAILASLASAAVNVVLVARVSGHRHLTVRIMRAMAVIVILGVAGSLLQANVRVLIPH